MVASNDEKYLFAATEIGPYVYSVADSQWYSLAAIHGVTAPDMLFWTVERVPHSNTIRYGTYGRGIWDITVDSVGTDNSSVRRHSAGIVSLGLHAVPSVTSAVTQLRFTLNEASDVSLRIFDLSGRCVRQIATHLGGGEQSLSWNAATDVGTSVPSGFYTAILTVGVATEFVKIEVVR